MSITSIRETLLQEVSVLPADYCPKVLHFIESLKGTNEGKNKEVPFSPEEWEEFCQEFEHSPKKALERAYSRGHYLTAEQS
jgi:hypothetical protein